MDKMIEIVVIILVITSPWLLTLLSIIVQDKLRLISFKKCNWHIHKYKIIDSKYSFFGGTYTEQCIECGKVNEVDDFC